MRRRTLLAVAAAVMVWLGCTSSAGAYYAITPMCGAPGQSTPCTNGWYGSALWVTWTWTPTQGNAVSGCVTQNFYVDTRTTVSCEVKGSFGDSEVTQDIDVEVSAPVASASLSRPPDHHGWYTHPVAVSFAGSAFSGISACTPTVTYSGPDSGHATVTGTCTDNAGKVASAVSTLPYDGSPAPVRLSVTPGDGTVDLRWSTSDVAPVEHVRLTRSPGLSGRRATVLGTGHGSAFTDDRVLDGVRYRYTVRLGDQAGRTLSATVVVIPGPRLQAPRAGAHLSAPPELAWTRVRGATYYNVQLFRVGTGKILSLWPTRPTLRLSSRWRFSGRHYRLRPGRYRWYVWPGFGRPAEARYGRLIGSRTFVVD